MNIGDYVLATKWNDGEAWDHWAVGFYAGTHPWNAERHMVVDAAGNQIRANGFRRCAPVTHELGQWLLQNATELESCGANLWQIVADYQRNQSLPSPEGTPNPAGASAGNVSNISK